MLNSLGIMTLPLLHCVWIMKYLVVFDLNVHGNIKEQVFGEKLVPH